jgi:hypothetical protein
LSPIEREGDASTVQLIGHHGSVVSPTCFILPSTMPYQATVR